MPRRGPHATRGRRPRAAIGLRLYNADVDEAERHYAEEDSDLEDEAEKGACQSFFELRQRALTGMEPTSVFRVAALRLLRMLRTNTKGSVLHAEVSDALGSHFRVLDAESQKFAMLQDSLREASTRQAKRSTGPDSAAAAASAKASAALSGGISEIAVVRLACKQMQKRALDLKMSSQLAVAESEDVPPLVSFAQVADFLEKALAFGDQLRRKHVELQQLRTRAAARASDPQ